MSTRYALLFWCVLLSQCFPSLAIPFASVGNLTIARDTFTGYRDADFKSDPMSIALAAAPIFLFARDTGHSPCYPESAIKLGSNPPEKNPGTDGNLGPAGIWTGVDCTDPGPYNGAYTKGRSFPLYVTPKYCSDLNQWRITYSVYYVHDGAMSEGHRHDWEDVTVVWTPTENEDNWQRNSVLLSQHGGRAHLGWGDVETVNGDEDVRDTSHGNYRAHPKVYVGFFKHPHFANKDDSFLTEDNLPSQRDEEYRSDDWYYIPTASDLVPGSVIGDWSAPNNRWNYGGATSSPWNINGGLNKQADICGFSGPGDDV
ncbi:hypothetical protein BT63DRAFT_483213 [Microthyrium microscopicum]|uniref:Uncharacterized protein n=1 Tax=Microthyrium microscopicum TaxID=703497 RepID=A0A6A6TWS3_9PEZI|nr:hypothetical protein BT63DRAFT_483213 [Microthyrium microscopicum]